MKNRIMKIKDEWGMLIIFGIIFGIVIHGMIIVNDLPNSDGILFNYYTWQNTVSSGRWFLGIVNIFSGPFTVPVINGLLAIFFVTLSALLIISIYNIKCEVNKIIVITLMVSFPALAAGMLYMFTVDGYAISIFLSVLAVWLLCKKATTYTVCLEAALCISFSMGIYQVYISITMTLCLLYIMQMILLGKNNVKKKIIQFLSSGILGSILYFIILRITLKLTHTKLITYQGINGVGKKVGFFELVIRIKTIYVQTILTFAKKLFIHKSLIIIFVGIVLIAVFELFRKCNYKTVLFLVVACVILIPICMLPIYLVSTDVDYYLLMKYSFVLVFIFVIVVIEYLKVNQNITGIIRVGLFVIIYSFIVSNNSMYEYAHLRYERTLLLANRIENQLESRDYDLSKPIGIFYEKINDEKYKVVSEIYPCVKQKYITIKGYNIKNFMEQYFTSKFTYINTDEKWEKIRKTREYQNIKLDARSFKIVETKKYIIVKVRAGVDEIGEDEDF